MILPKSIERKFGLPENNERNYTMYVEGLTQQDQTEELFDRISHSNFLSTKTFKKGIGKQWFKVAWIYNRFGTFCYILDRSTKLGDNIVENIVSLRIDQICTDHNLEHFTSIFTGAEVPILSVWGDLSPSPSSQSSTPDSPAIGVCASAGILRMFSSRVSSYLHNTQSGVEELKYRKLIEEITDNIYVVKKN
jgi:hypothetical protein